MTAPGSAINEMSGNHVIRYTYTVWPMKYGHHYNDVKWESVRHILSAYRLLVQQQMQATNKENTKNTHYLPIVRE